MKKIGLVLSFVLFLSILYQANAQWELQNPKLTNLDILDISYSTSNDIVLVGEDGIILKSSNGGQSFEKQVHSSLKDFVSVSFINSLNGWAVSSEGIAIKTTDGGINWVDVFIDSNRKYYSVCFIDDEKGFIGCDSGIIYTTIDGGYYWDTTRTQLNNSITDIRFTDSFTGYVMESYNNYLSRSFIYTTDGGINWSTRNFHLDPYAFSVLSDSLIFTATNGQIYKSTNSGLSWSLISNSISAHDIFFISENKGWVIDPSGEIFVTTNGGVNWEKAVIDFPFSIDKGWQIKFFNEYEGIIAGNNGVIFKTTDGGYSWFNVEAATALELRKIDFINDQVGFILGARPYLGQIIKTTDKGHNWEMISAFNDTLIGYFSSIDFYNENLGIIVGSWGFAQKTTDGGSTWSSLAVGSNLEFTDVKIINSSTYYLFSASAFYKTTNAGNTWTISPIGLSSGANLLYFDGFLGYLQNMTNGVLARTYDFGANWEMLFNTPPWMRCGDFTSEETGFLAGHYGNIYQTTDYGDTWTDISVAGFSSTINGIDFIDQNEGWIVTQDSKVLHTTDTGLNWSQQFVEGNNKLKKILMINENEGWIIGDYGLILHTTNGGVTFIEEENSVTQTKEFLLQQNYPNPFNPSTKISWQSPVSSWQTLKIYDILGKEVATLVDEYRNAGSYEVDFPSVETLNATSLPSGVYFYQLKSGNYIETKKMVLLK